VRRRARHHHGSEQRGYADPQVSSDRHLIFILQRSFLVN